MAARLVPVTVPRAAVGAVLVLHGGAARPEKARPENMAVSPAQLSVLRMIPVARQIGRAGRGQLAVFRLLNSYRGWDTRHTPVQDVHWALGEISRRLGRPVPTCLVGHSLGGRAALLAADQPGVVSIVALAPWLYARERADLAGRRVLIVHGSNDRVASPQHSADLARTLMPHGTVGYVLVRGGTHALLRRHRLVASLYTGFAVATLLGRDVQGPVAAILDGQHWAEI